MQTNSIKVKNLQSIFKSFMEKYDIWNKATGIDDSLESDYTTFIEEWKHHYARLSELTDAESLFSCCKEMKSLLQEFIPIFGRFSLDKKNEDIALKKMSETHKVLYDSVKDEKDEDIALKKIISETHKILYDSVNQELKKINALLERDRELKSMGYILRECGTVVYEDDMLCVTHNPNGTVNFIF